MNPEYDDPYVETALYDLEYRDLHEDIDHYVQLAKAFPGPILELGCGNGRITLPLAYSGKDVIGIDRSVAMLADLQRKCAQLPALVSQRIQSFQGDFTKLTLNQKFNFILLPFNAIHHCEGAQALQRLLEGVRQSLHPHGIFALDCYLPDPILYARDPNGQYEERIFIDPVSGESLETWEQGWWEAEKRIHHVVYVYRDPRNHERKVHLKLHMYERDELVQLFAQAGFLVHREASDFKGTPLRSTSLKWVLELRLQ